MSVLFADEASFYRQPTQALLWADMGRRQPKMPYNSGANTVMRVVGLMDAVTGRVNVWDFHRITAKRVASCFSNISSMYPTAEKIYVVMDNWPAHHQERVRKVLEAQPGTQALFLPTYSPWLNNIEKLWKWVRQHVTHAHPWAEDFNLFREHILREFARLESGLPEIRRYYGLNHLFS